MGVDSGLAASAPAAAQIIGDGVLQRDRIREIRVQLADVAVLGFALALTVLVPISLLRAFDVGWQPIMSGLVALGVGYWVVAAVRHRLSFHLKAGYVLATCILFGMLGMLSFGLSSFGLLLLLLSATFGVAFYGARGGIICAVAGAIVIALVGWAFARGGLRIQVDLDAYMHAPSTWVSAAAAFLALVTVLAFTMGRLDRDLVRLIAELGQSSEELRRMAVHDELTGLPNRRVFMTRGEQEMRRIRRYGDPGFLAILDLDHFKAVNDEHGHAMGDEALRRFAALLADESREPDHIARIGGEEFTLLLPSTGENGALTVLERVRARWHATTVELDGDVVTSSVSIGMTEMRPDDVVFEHILQRADTALYEAKETGRNRVVFNP